MGRIMTERKKPLRWHKEPNEQGLASVCQSPRGAELRIGSDVLAHVYAHREGWSRNYEGWYWVAQSDVYQVPLKNTCSAPVSTLEDAKAAAKAYVKEHLKR
jgi:hypothetical protein